MGPGRISSPGLALADIPRHHAAGPDHRAVADGDARKNDRPAADPDVAADAHWPSKFQPLASRLRVPGMVGGIDLHRGSDLGALADADFDNVQDDAVEVQEDAVADTDVVAEIAKERRADHGIGAYKTEAFAEQRMPHRHG